MEPTSATEPQRERGAVWPVLALIVLAVATYANTVGNPFVYDDNWLVVKNPAIRSLSQIPAIIGFTEEGFQLNTRWTRTVTYALEYAAVGARPALYHGTNIALHALAGVLVFLLIGRLSRRPALGFWTAALFLAHPVQAEVVAHVSGRRGLLAAVFSLATLILLERFTRSGRGWHLAAAVVTLYLGVFSKEVALMTPVAFVAIDTWRARREQGGPLGEWIGAHVANRLRLYSALGVLSLGLGGALFFLSPDLGVAGSPGLYDTVAGGFSVIERIGVVGLALRLIAIPVGLTVDYSFNALGAGGGPPWIELCAFAAGLALTVWGLARANWAGLAGIWFLVFFFPYLGIVKWHEAFAERFLYLPIIGVLAAVAAGGLELARRAPRPAVAAGGLTLVTLVGLTVMQNRVWSSELALWGNAVKQRPGAARAHKALADAYLADTRPRLAAEHYAEAVRIFPGYVDARTGVAVAQIATRDFELALKTLDEILDLRPGDAKALNTKAYIHETMGDLPGAFEMYRQVVETNPTFADGYNNLGRLYVFKGDIDSAIEMYETALEHNPALVRAMQNLAIVYREGLGDEVKAAWWEAEAAKLSASR